MVSKDDWQQGIDQEFRPLQSVTLVILPFLADEKKKYYVYGLQESLKNTSFH